jgi:hypothetical protein
MLPQATPSSFGAALPPSAAPTAFGAELSPAAAPAAFGSSLPLSSLGDLLSHDDGRTPYFLFVLYLCSSFYAIRRFRRMTAARERDRAASSAPARLGGGSWDAPRLFVLSILFASVLRTASFGVLCALAFCRLVEPLTGSSVATPTPTSRALAVVFNVGDWAAVSSYMLLALVWVETMQLTRGHLFDHSSLKLRHDWLVAFVVLTLLLYAVQAALYACVFLAPVDPDATLRDIYAVVGALNLVIPVLLAIAWAAVHFCLYSGFPFVSAGAKRKWEGTNRLLLSWTMGRLLWAVASVCSSSASFVAAVGNVGSWLFSVIVVTLIILAELLPFLTSLGTSALKLFRVSDEDELGELSRSGTEPTDEALGVVVGAGASDDDDLRRSLLATGERVCVAPVVVDTASAAARGLGPPARGSKRSSRAEDRHSEIEAMAGYESSIN